VARPKVDAGGGWPAIRYTFRKARQAGGFLATTRKLLSKNSCKTCAFGMGGQAGGMRNERGRFPEVCKKSVQAQAGDMGRPLSRHFLESTPLSTFARMGSAEMEELGRLTFPIILEDGDTYFRGLDWDEALQRIADNLKASSPDETFFYASGRSSNEAAFLFQLVARAYGSPNIHNCSYYCHQASGVGLSMVFGSGTASIQLEDLEKADFALVIGANPASNHPRMIRYLVELRRRGGKVMVINPLKELGLVRFRVPSDPSSLLFGSDVSDLYLQPRIGGDIAVLKALLKGVIARGAVDETFVRDYTSGWEGVRRDAEESHWDELLRACGLTRAEVDAAVAQICEAKRGIFLWAMGLTHHEHGVDNVLALSNLALARGWLGRPGCGLLPIRGHSNVQGVGSVGVSPQVKESFARRLEELYDIHVPAVGGQDTFSSMRAAAEGRVRAAVMLGGNLWGSNPDHAWAGKALRSIDLTAQISTKLNPGHIHGRGKTTLVLPALARDEEWQATTQESMFNFVRLSDGGPPNVDGDMRSEVEIVADLAERVLPDGRFDWSQLRSHESLRRAIATVVPGYSPIADIGTTLTEFQIPGRSFHEPRFNTKDGRANFHIPPLPAMELAADELLVMTIRSEGQFNTVVYDEEDLYRGNERRDVIMLSQADAFRHGLSEGQTVGVRSEVGSMRVHVAVVDIAEGSAAMYYPEANVLVGQRIDPRSMTPAFKSVRVRLEAG